MLFINIKTANTQFLRLVGPRWEAAGPKQAEFACRVCPSLKDASRPVGSG